MEFSKHREGELSAQRWSKCDSDCGRVWRTMKEAGSFLSSGLGLTRPRRPLKPRRPARTWRSTTRVTTIPPLRFSGREPGNCEGCTLLRGYERTAHRNFTAAGPFGRSQRGERERESGSPFCRRRGRFRFPCSWARALNYPGAALRAPCGGS